MFRFLESIRVEGGRGGVVCPHQARINKTAKQFGFDAFDLYEWINTISLPNYGRHKLRIVYGPGFFEHELMAYKIPDIKSLKAVKCTAPDYAFKYENRQQLDVLYSQRKPADDVLIVHNNLLTDTWTCNLALFDGHLWYTPQTPLLSGVQRAFLLQQGTIHEKQLAYQALPSFKKIRLFNAMICWEDQLDIDIHHVFPLQA